MASRRPRAGWREEPRRLWDETALQWQPMAHVLESDDGGPGRVKAALYLPGAPGSPWQMYRVLETPAEPTKARLGFRGN